MHLHPLNKYVLAGAFLDRLEEKEFNMSDAKEQHTMKVLYRTKKLKINVGATVGEILEDIQGETGIAVNDQTLILRGKKLNLRDLQATPESVGLQAGTTTMLLRRKASASQHAPKAAPNSGIRADAIVPQLRELRDAEKLVMEARDELTETAKAVERHTQGFLDAPQTAAALCGDEVRLGALEERLMKVLEQMDSLAAPAEVHGKQVPAQWRAERKEVVDRAQSLLNDVDGLKERIEDLRKDVFGEVDRRRGKN